MNPRPINDRTRCVLAGVRRLERAVRKLRVQAHERIVAGTSDEADLKLAYALHETNIARKLDRARDMLLQAAVDVTGRYVPEDPFQAFAIVLAHDRTQPGVPLPRGTYAYVRRGLETESMRRTRRNEKSWRSWFDIQMLILHIEALEAAEPDNTGQNRTSGHVPKSAENVPNHNRVAP